MSTRIDDPDDHWDDDLDLYVEAFREVEVPTEAARAATIAGLRRATRTRTPWPWIAAASAVAAAVIVIAVLGSRSTRPSPDLPTEPMQSGYAHEPDDDDGAAVQPRAPGRSEAPAPDPADVEADAESEAQADAPLAPSEVAADVDDASATSSPAAPRSRRAPAPSVPDASALATETALFDTIQRALQAGRAPEALTAIARHEREFPRGVFRLERILAKAQALCAAGRPVQARKVRDAFLRQRAGSHLAPRMREVCPE